MMKNICFVFILISSVIYGQVSEVDSTYNRYKPDLEIFGAYDPTITELENNRVKLNENLGRIILEQDPVRRKELIIQNTGKVLHQKLLKLSPSELENLRQEYDQAFKAKIGYKCLLIHLEYLEDERNEMEKSMVTFLVDRGYNLADFKKLPEEQRKEILKSWTYKK